MSFFVISQLLISTAIVFDLASFQCKQRRQVVGCLSIAGVLICSHFILLSQWTAAALMACATVRYFTSVFTTSWRAMWFFLIANFVIFTLTFSGVVSLISVIGATIQTIAAFQKNDKVLRQMMVMGTACWIVHNIIVNSPAAILMELLFLLSNVIAYRRFYCCKSNLTH